MFTSNIVFFQNQNLFISWKQEQCTQFHNQMFKHTDLDYKYYDYPLK
jgi:hypothetical protein